MTAAKKPSRRGKAQPARPPTPLQLALYGKVTERIQKAMAAKGLTNTELGRLVSPDSKNAAATITEWYNGRTKVPPDKREIVAKALGLKVEDLEPEPLPANPAIAQAAHSVPPRISTSRAPSLFTGPTKAPNGHAHHAAPDSPLAFIVTESGMVNIRLNVTLPLEKGKSVLTMLMGIDDLLGAGAPG